MIENMKTFEYRLYLTKEQARLLMACLAESRQIYNRMLEMVKQQFEDKQTFPSKYDLEHAFKGQGSEHVPATTVQMLADRLTKSLQRFLAAKQNALPGIGFPRFKQPNRWHSIQLRQYGKDCYLHEDQKHLIVPKKLGHASKSNSIVRSRELPRRFTWYTVLMDTGMRSSSVRWSHRPSTLPPHVIILLLALMLVSRPFSLTAKAVRLRTRASIARAPLP
jgi:transposase